MRQVGQRAMQFLGTKRHALANGERRRVMVDAECKNHRIGLGSHEMGADYITRPQAASPIWIRTKCLLFQR
jgi:hypothetical protein